MTHIETVAERAGKLRDKIANGVGSNQTHLVELAALVHHLAVKVTEHYAPPAGVVPQTVGVDPVTLGLGETIRHADAASWLHLGTIVYNTNDVRNILGDENRHYFRHIARGIWQPCNSAGVVHVLPDFPDGFRSGQLFMPVHVYAI